LIYTRFERARILGARALQISLGAPPLLDVPEAVVDPLALASLEFQSRNVPLTVSRSYHAGD